MTSAQSLFIGFGSNQGDSVELFRKALSFLRSCPGFSWIKSSSLYRSEPVGVLSQPDFLNAVAWFGSALAPEEVLDTLLSVEAELGRVRNATRWGPRTLDLDLLVYGEASVQSERLILPHPELANRKFVLLPMLELAPQLEVPGKGKVEVLYQAVASDKVERIGSAHDWSM